MIVGTAGHIDHGKTRLVRALTGIETDRLPEERTRGISIELGYAYVPVDATATLGFVDVPGHERFVHTMVAGATGIDVALLVVAADDGVMPQTREHLAILQLLGVDRGAVALTKIDRVDVARIAQVEIQIAALLARTSLQDAPVFACNSLDADDAGVAALRSHLHAWAAGTDSAHPAERQGELFRMPVDRVFSLAGHGTLVTGAVHGGVTGVGAHLQLMPAGNEVRVRSIHAQNQASEQAMAGQRCALNLASIARDAIDRGDWIADPRALLATTRVDVRLRLPALAAPLRDWAPLHIHWGTMHRQARVVLLEHDDHGNGQLVQLVFDTPVCAMCGDRFIARDSAATRTLGGGIVLDPDPPQRRRRSPARLAWLGALEQLAAGAGSGPLLQQAPAGVSLAALQRYCRRAIEQIELPEDARRIATRQDTVIILAAHWQALRDQVVSSLRDWHERRPDEPGVDSGRLQRSTLPALAVSLWNALLQDLLDDGSVQRVGAWWRLPGHDHAPPERERLLLQRVLPRLHAGGFDPPWVRTVATDLGLAEDELRAVLRRAAARGDLFQIVPDLFYAPARIAELAAILAQLSHATGTVDAAAFRDAIGLGRKRSIQILEFFNRVGYTRRVGDHHRPRGDLQWNAPHG
ncbi:MULTISPECIES: selenocysteine-specific translation elongation factor [Stenotrophomonas]|jgi:selenocysteine-specific elongation factor|uniref:selenocysteine-specific translation elongation factor n=1 Tax=Stenotrophomonas TaxID=40323 RepID=UPI00201CECBA|nr:MULTISPECIES: selenocysteine-specific translation elongation factor [Stenotrophomonas]MBN5026567.1 selenocysteine-specific translation elongation factor [Stenotrophomonas maltophilia]MDH1275450.1 selenocysteine-specific translation elongation factor [Stenotrophomonas sp. GD03937]MDH1485226.1 selenocysteine-specific translation elongation factor [Stenotrophomonas sp. GD03712]UQY95285.1 selenocysteine-specific translation elongation factor [Stenotrophomonas maltophilia]WON68012.1 selenocystei